MIARRGMVLGGMALGALGVAEYLKPRRRLKLLNGSTIEKAMPTEFAQWESQADLGLVSPEQAGRLAQTLYSEIVSRTYFHKETGAGVMVLVAYGDTQSDLLQLHRPESCYPAVGFTLNSSVVASMPVGGGLLLPGRRVVATLEDRHENIFYWTRLGERLPVGGGDQRNARLQNAMEGVGADGILVRCSAVGEAAPSFQILAEFVPDLLRAIPKPQKKAFVGSALAARFA